VSACSHERLAVLGDQLRDDVVNPFLLVDRIERKGERFDGKDIRSRQICGSKLMLQIEVPVSSRDECNVTLSSPWLEQLDCDQGQDSKFPCSICHK